MPFLALVVGCRVPDWTVWRPDAKCHDEVYTVRGIDYLTNREDSQDREHQLDVYVPRGKRDCPVVVLVHGGAWMMGDNRCCGLYSSVGQFLASQGIIAVLPNYRLSPGVKHPAHVQDVAAAVAWTTNHIRDFGGRTDELYLMGHSAGGHLVSLLATDEQYLAAKGLTSSVIKGVISLSGVYRLTPERVNLTLGGEDRNSVRWDKLMPVRGDSDPSQFAWPGLPVKVNLYEPVFGDDPHVRTDASPIHHVRPGLPPFLICYAENDLPTLPQIAEEFHVALQENRVDAKLMRIEHRNHNSIVFQAIRPDDPVGRVILEFISRRESGNNSSKTQSTNRYSVDP